MTTDADATISASANGVTRTANLHLYASGLTLITLNPPSVGGGASSTGTVYLAYAAPPGGKVVTLSDDSPYSTTPPSVTVLQGKTTASFVVTTVSVSDPQVARITGVLDGVNRFSDLSIVPAQLVRVSVNPTSVAGGLSASGSVALNGPAPEGGATVQLSSSNPIAAQVPEAVTILQGNFAKVFNVTTTIVGEETNVTITATRGSVTKTTNLLVQGIQLLAFTISPSTVVGGVQSSGTVTIAHPAPSGGLVVSFFNENPAASLYATVRIPAGATTASFPIFTRVVTTRTIVTITATRGNSKTATITLLPVP